MTIQKEYKNIFLLGFMGAGKTTVARILSKKLAIKFCDIDKLIENESGFRISEIFSNFGEDYFRDIETKTLSNVAKNTEQVVSTGGGVVIRERNWKIMRKSGFSFYLKASIDTIWNRIKHSSSRPLLSVNNPYQKAADLLSARTPLYEKADFVIQTNDLRPEQVADIIMDKL